MNADTFINNMLGEVIYKIVNGQDALPKDQQDKLKDKKPFKNSNFFTWCTPGIPVSPDDFAFLKGLRKPIDFEKFKDLPENERESKRGDDAYALTVAMDNFSMLVDTVPDKSGMVNSLQVWEPQQRISQIYESVLFGCEVADSVPSPDAQERIKKIRELTNETMVDLYTKYMKEYSDAYEKYVELMGKAVTGNAGDVQKASVMGPQYYKAVTAAYDLWVSRGLKTQYEKLVADLEQLEGVSMSLLVKEYREIFRKNQRESLLDGSKYNVSRLVPASFYESTGWTQYSFNASSLKTTSLANTKGLTGGARYGIFGGAKGSFKRVETASSLNFDNFEMEFELTQVPIIRNWFREDFLLSTKWRIGGSPASGSTLNPGDILSNGNIENPEGKLFAYPTVILFARNIKVTKSVYDQVSSAMSTDAGGSGYFSLGPFSLGTKASYSKSEKSLEVKQEGSKMVMPGMSIIGFRNHMPHVPVPNPDPAIKNWIGASS
jgi:hypothetical protein